jgi:hypothetical protein
MAGMIHKLFWEVSNKAKDREQVEAACGKHVIENIT